jgi:hypothetical protein
MKKILIPVFLTLGLILSYSLTFSAKPAIAGAVNHCSKFYDYDSELIEYPEALCAGMGGSFDESSLYACTFNEERFNASIPNLCLSGMTLSTEGTEMYYRCESDTDPFTSPSKLCAKDYAVSLRWTPTRAWTEANDWRDTTSFGNYGYTCSLSSATVNVCTAPGAQQVSGSLFVTCCGLSAK